MPVDGVLVGGMDGEGGRRQKKNALFRMSLKLSFYCQIEVL